MIVPVETLFRRSVVLTYRSRLRPARDQVTVAQTGVHHVSVGAWGRGVRLLGTRGRHMGEVVVLSRLGGWLLGCLLLLLLWLEYYWVIRRY